MKSIVKHFFNYKILFFILFAQNSYCQLSDFSFSVVHTNETCENNGTLAFATSGTTNGATMLYSIYLLPNITTAIGVTAGNGYSGLSAGNYRIIATQSLGTESNSQQQDIVILDQIVQLEYNLSGGSHLCDQKITVNVTQGIPVQYEIISGPVLKPLQTSNVFTGLTPGVYLIRVFDNCGDGIVQNYTLVDSSGSGLQIGLINTITSADCNIASVTQTLNNSSSEDFIYPITLHYVLTLPSGQQIILDQVLTSGNQDLITISQEIPLFPDQSFSYSLEVIDGCGNVFVGTGTLAFPVTVPSISAEITGCNSFKYTIKNAVSATVMEAPSGYPHATPHVLTPSGLNTFILESLPEGEYSFSLIDLCGVEHIKELVVDVPDILPPLRTILNGCEPGFGSVSIITSSDFASVKIIQAPASAGFTLPYDVSFNIDSASFNFYMNSLPQGTYVFKTLDVCNNEYELVCPIGTYQQTATVNVIENCGSFDIQVIPQGNVSNPMSYWLQKFDPVANTWGHPVSGVVYQENTTPSTTNSMVLAPNTINYNIAVYGHFRILGRYSIFGNAISSQSCLLTVEEFDFFAQPKINNVVSVSCQDGTYDVIVDVSGVAPFNYKIITKNNNPFEIENLNSSLFLGVEAAVYGFEVEDDCGNILQADYEIGISNGFPIEIDNLCSGQNVSLSVLSFSFLSYEWWKDDETTTILGTSNTLNFSTFDPVADSGIYHVRVFYANNPASCINFISDIEVFLNEDLPDAGIASNPIYCGSPGSIDLFSLLSDYDEDGTWQEITNSGMLSGNNWDASALQSGTYKFKYRVGDICNNFDETTLIITLKTIPETPEISVDTLICSNESLQLFASDVQSGSYQWSGPNGFTSVEQNPIIENPTSLNDGMYSLKILLDGCESETVSTTLNVNDFPVFVIEGGCENNQDNYVLRAFPVENSFQENEVSYSWTGPEGFSAHENPISVTNFPIGIYSLTITNAEGCSNSSDFDVKSTVCRIPRGISPNNDGDNDSFDLSGFDILNLKIYSRYGRLVYEKENYKSDWYGQDFKNRELPDATYFYYVLMNDGEERTGWVYKTH
ncbi:gliding motility-associated-like protein [Flavobacterium arsenatis]|uniref:Gliding motility-associated-like protein n=1 Tax=Flavobacterium arsenatis TaxID=1484332 RepID=A0ABU1TKG5_9FLAO|nr:gliding motility-associated C-terminal domain-containing protein [Flavobacterium arsenatis]MDR6966297.1 gliding motility-associated-like protein [Flavobacterium arsenatis]